MAIVPIKGTGDYSQSPFLFDNCSPQWASMLEVRGECGVEILRMTNMSKKRNADIR
jgi:hypothetical protein